MAGPPTALSCVFQTDGTVDLTWINHGPYSSLAIYRRLSPAAYAKIDDLNPEDESYTDNDSLASNATYQWRLTSDLGDSNEDSCTKWTATPSADTVHMSDYKAVSVAFVVSKVETFNMSEATEVEHETVPLEPQNYVVTEIDTVTMLDSYETALIGGQNWMYYLGSAEGAIYPYHKNYRGDADADIEAYYQTKALDFADQYPQYIDTWKTVTRIYLDYIDLGECAITVSVSTDDGTTWTNSSRTLGNGSLTVKTARFDYIGVTGRFFSVKIANASNDRLFQITRLKVEFEPHSDWFSTG